MRIIAVKLLLAVAVPALLSAPAYGYSSGVLRFFEEPGPPPPAGSPDPLLGHCLADAAGLESLGTQRCEQRDGLNSAYDVAISPDGEHLYSAAAISDAVGVFARDPASGRLTPRACISEAGTEGCTDGRALDGAIAAAVSPDGKNLYVTSRVSDAVAVFARNATTGALSQLAGTSGCASEGGAGGCSVARGLDHALGVAVSADGENVYVSGRGSDAIAVFARDRDTGALSQLPGEAGCLHDSLTSLSGLQGCAPARGLDGAYSMTLSPDDRDAYVGARVSDAVTAFRRNGDGTLSQVAGEGGCISYAALAGCRQVGSALDGVTDVAVAPEGTSAYAVSYGGDSVSTLRRDPGTGALSYRSCLSQDGTSPECGAARALDYANAVEVSPDGRNVYVSAGYGDAIAVFERGADGALTQKPPAPGTSWSDGCLSWRGHKWAKGGVDLSQPDHSDHYCARALALYYPYALELSPDGAHLYVASTESDTVAMYRRLDTRGYPRPKGAAPLRVPLVLAYERCTVPDRVHGAPLDSASCSAPRQVSNRLTVGTPDANGKAAHSAGVVRFGVRAGDPATAVDEADVPVRMELSDVRNAGDLSDYAGELQLAVELQITDAEPFGGAVDQATVTPIDYSLSVGCAATADTSIGGRCDLVTSADALAPGSVKESWRTLWQMGPVRIFDGGADGRASTADNRLFATQGVLIP